MENEYYDIPISYFMFWLSFISAIMFSFEKLFIVWLLPIYAFVMLKCKRYYYNQENLIVETGIIAKKKKIVPLYRVVNISAEDSIFKVGKLYIKEKEQKIVLDWVADPKEEMTRLVRQWEKAREKNIRNEII